jgi:acyl carrier protein
VQRQPPGRQEIAEEVRSLLLRHPESSRHDGHLPDDLSLGEDGLGLDSLAIVEVLVECEDRFGVEAAPLIEQGPVRVGALVAHIVHACSDPG